MSLCVSPWVYPVRDSLCFLDLTDSFLPHVEEVCNYNCFRNFLSAFLIFFSPGTPYNLNVGAFNIVPKVSEHTLNFFSFLSLYSALISYFHHSILQLTYPFLCLSYSAIDSFRYIVHFFLLFLKFF